MCLLAMLSSITFLAKGKVSKSISLFLSDIGPKRFLLIRLQNFKSNIFLVQRKLGVERKILRWLWRKMVVAILVTRLMDE